MLELILEKWWLLTKIAALGAFCGFLIAATYQVEKGEKEDSCG